MRSFLRITAITMLFVGTVAFSQQLPVGQKPATPAVTDLGQARVTIAEQALQIAQLKAQVSQLTTANKELNGALQAISREEDSQMQGAVQAAQQALEQAKKDAAKTEEPKK